MMAVSRRGHSRYRLTAIIQAWRIFRRDLLNVRLLDCRRNAMACECVSCSACGGTGTVWFSFPGPDRGGKYLGNHRCDDLDELDTCMEVRRLRNGRDLR